MNNFTILLLSVVLGVTVVSATELRFSDFGGKADGKTDDGPAILKMVEAARTLEGQPVRLVFPKEKVIHAKTGKGRYLFALQHTENVTVDGNGSTFLLDPHLRMMDLDYAINPVIKNFNVDYTLTMFIDSVIENIDPKAAYVDVKVLVPGEETNLGGPTKADGEQWFGGFVWCENGPHMKAATHYAVKGAQVLGPDRARAFFDGKAIPNNITDRIKLGETRFSIPRPGVAHRYGPGPLFKIHDTRDGLFENISVWGAPWFTFSVYRTEGLCRFNNVDVVPKPGSQRLMAGCRDAYHVTGNRAKLIFDGCDTAGLGDDDYNFCILSSKIKQVLSPTKLIIKQKFPIQYNPMRVGETLMVMNSQNQLVGSARIATYEEASLQDGSEIIAGGRYCPSVTIILETAIPGLEKDLHVWSKEAANPDTTMRNCTATFSIRMQTSLTVEKCTFTCYNVAYGFSPRRQNVEGPGAEFLKISDSVFKVGRGSGMVVQSGGKGSFETTRVRNVHIENSTFHAPLHISKAKAVTLRNNRLYSGVKLGKQASLDQSGNQLNDKPFTFPSN